MDEALLNLARSANRVAELAHAACMDRLPDPAELQSAMTEYDRRASGYRGDLSPGDFVRQDAERYDDPIMLEAMDRVAQLLDREFG